MLAGSPFQQTFPSTKQKISLELTIWHTPVPSSLNHPFIMDSEHSTDVPSEVINNSTDSNPQIAGDGTADGSNVEAISQPDLTVDEPDVTVDGEPYVGQEFESEAAALEFYSAYAMRLGFMTRINQTTHCDGSVISRTLVCSREGYYRPKNGNEMTCKRSRQPRSSFRVGCRARVFFKQQRLGKWVIRSLVKEHTHPLNDSISQRAQLPRDDKRVSDLTQELMIERRRSASLKEFINLLLNHIEEHTQGLSEKIQYIAEKVNKIESEGRSHKKSR